MSQNPPDPPTPVEGHPPRNVTPYASGMHAQLHPRTSGAAVTALVLGILLCVPLITNAGAILFGVIGIRSTREPNVRGRGIAIAGLTLGIVGILAWTGLGGTLGLGWVQTAPDRAVTRSFVQDLCAGNAAAAQSLCATSVTPAQVQQAITYLHGCGTLNSYTNSSFNIQWNTSGGATAVIGGVANFSSGTHSITVTLNHPRHGTPVIQGYSIQ